MLPRTYGILFSPLIRATWLVGILLFLRLRIFRPSKTAITLVCREDLSPAHREQLAGKLRAITGLPELKFDAHGILREGRRPAVGGSASARQLLANSIHGLSVAVIEDASKHPDVAFARVIPGRWKQSVAAGPPVFVSPN